ncbi:hypothetical protein LUZ63_003377 [Rhynchospora breviuscula]|uniref:F-box domain-containing protein n=1 Tax=Rhynchospora breviuscula TaxID=2022672 RepID=A0A9Q0D0K6_9POAL|nr:hypothetical protein LUZ63_003377 [Rhynchospora breviuscula]
MHDWSELPLDLLNFISRRLLELQDFIHFRAVCKRWRSAAPVADHPRQLPWVVGKRAVSQSNVQFLSLSTGKIYSVECNEAKGKQLLGSSHDYMLSFDPERRLLSLLNPLTRKEIHLPPTDSEWHRPLYIGPDPVQSGDDVVICWSSLDVLTVGLCQPGDQEWKKIQISGGVDGQTYYKDMYYVTERETLATKIMDIKTGSTLSIIPAPICTSTGHPCCLEYLIVSSGEVLGVSGYNGARGKIENYVFDVYQLDDKNKIPRWIKIDSIGDRILFLDDTIGFCLSASEFNNEDLKGDCIYFIAYLYDDWFFCFEFPLCRYNMKNPRVETVDDALLGDTSSWFFPSIL